MPLFFETRPVVSCNNNHLHQWDDEDPIDIKVILKCVYSCEVPKSWQQNF